MSSIDLVKSLTDQLKFARSEPDPFIQKLLIDFSPVQIRMQIIDSDFGSSVPISIKASVLSLGLGVPLVPMSFSVGDKEFAKNINTDENGDVVTKTTLTSIGKTTIKAFIGPVDVNNPAYTEQDLSINSVKVLSNIVIDFSANNKVFSTPASIMFPFYDGGPVYDLIFPEIVNKGVNNAWLLQAPASYRVLESKDLIIPYVKPTLSIKASSPKISVGDNVLLTAVVTTEKGLILQSQPLTITKNGEEIYSSNSDQLGQASTLLSLEEGVHEFKASWLGMNFSQPIKVEVVKAAAVPTPITEYAINIAGGSEGLQRHPSLDYSKDIKVVTMLGAKFKASDGHCSDIRIHFLIDDEEKAVSDWLGPGEDTGWVYFPTILPNAYKTYKLTISPEGRVGGCNEGTLKSWKGVLSIIQLDTSQTGTASITTIGNGIIEVALKWGNGQPAEGVGVGYPIWATSNYINTDSQGIAQLPIPDNFDESGNVGINAYAPNKGVYGESFNSPVEIGTAYYKKRTINKFGPITV